MYVNRFFVLILIVSFTSCKDKKSTPQAGNRNTGPLTVDGFLVEERSISDLVDVPGSLRPAEETQLRTEVKREEG
jgi:hypothetical protein